ncbi:cadherin-like beta sandwich domain-containing protein [Paenibacillus sp. P26]|nr:cadherin-like beta sandwich domain-containing protein [Paenibacillus sp. P26]
MDASAQTLSWNNVEGYPNASDYEYSLDGGITWTTATANPQTLTSVPNPVSNAKVRVKGGIGRAPGIASTVALPTMSGGVGISGVAKVGQTLTANVTGITYTPSTTGNVPIFQWYRNGVAIPNATGSSYTLTADDLGAAITLKVTADGVHATGSVTSAATGAVAPADGATAPEAPVEASKTTTSITPQAVSGQEYSKDGGVTWQDSPTFSGLTPNTEYTFVTRVKATATQNASAASAGTTIRTVSGNADLSGLTLSSGTLSPAFGAGTTNYTSSVSYGVSSTTVTATVYDSAHATVTANVYNSAGTLVKGPITLTNGVASDSPPLSVGTNTIWVVVTAQDGTTQTYTVTVTRRSDTDSSSSGPGSTGGSGGGGSSGGSSGGTTDIGFRVIVNGKEYEQIATGSLTKENGQNVLTATVDAAKLAAQLAQEGDKPVIIIPVATVSADKVTAVLTGDAVKAMENRSAILEVQTANGNYKLPASQIAIDRLSAQLGGQVKLSDIVVHVDIAKSDAAKVQLAASTAEKGKFSVVVPPVDFTVKASYNGRTVEVDKFNAYVQREIPVAGRHRHE